MKTFNQYEFDSQIPNLYTNNYSSNECGRREEEQFRDM